MPSRFKFKDENIALRQRILASIKRKVNKAGRRIYIHEDERLKVRFTEGRTFQVNEVSTIDDGDLRVHGYLRAAGDDTGENDTPFTAVGAELMQIYTDDLIWIHDNL